MIYEGGTLKQILVDGGYVTFSGDAPQYHFYIQDHLGNNRVIANAGGTKEQVNHYYPFGGLFGQSTNGDVQRYKYNGKELDRMHGLDWYDYGARHMSPDVGRFTTIDPMAENYYSISPYAYCGNNPVKNIDPDGRKFDLSSMTEEQLEQYNCAINFLQENSKLFSKLYEILDNSINTFVVSIGNPISSSNNERIEGQFIANDAGGGEILLSKDRLINGGISNTVYAEEYFHAYQHENTSSYDKGSFNREFEAKSFATAVGMESTGYGEYNGMEAFQINIRSELYGNSMQPLSPQGVNSKQFLQDYRKSANSYANYNIRNNIGNENYRSSTVVSPYSLIKIVNSAYK